MIFRHEIRVRYGEVDLQGVVFNAHYLAYCDDAADVWLRIFPSGIGSGTWDIMLKRSEITWTGSAGLHDVLSIAVGVRRWGNSSFDVGFEGTVADRPVFSATNTYVAVVEGTKQTMRVPDDFREAAAPYELPELPG
jgi:acyl-CoA thioester hydrolase